MKNIFFLLIGTAILLLASCSGSDTYRGAWKAMDAHGGKFEIVFEAKSITLKDSTGKTATFGYTQNSVKIQNSVKTYGIRLADGREYQINFPNTSNENIGLIKDNNDVLMYTIGRSSYVSYDDIYKLK